MSAREPVFAHVGPERTSPAGAALDVLAEAAFSGPKGRARIEALIERFDAEVGALAVDDQDFELLQLARTDWALCDVPAEPGARPGDSWALRALRGELPGVPAVDHSLALEAASCIVGLFEVYPGRPTWVRDRISGVVLRLCEAVGPFEVEYEDEPVALWELRLIADPDGGFHLARPPIDYPIELLDTLEEEFARRFGAEPWPTMQDLRRARLRHFRAGKRTPIARMLRWK